MITKSHCFSTQANFIGGLAVIVKTKISIVSSIAEAFYAWFYAFSDANDYKLYNW